MKYSTHSYLILVLSLFIIGCDKKSENTTYNPIINPAQFSTSIDNQYFPLTIGKTYNYQGLGANNQERSSLTVTSQTKTIMGVTCVVVMDSEWVGNELEEVTADWYAQDDSGNVWYFGEESKEFENGQVVSTEGSWEAGVDGAQPGIVMKGNPIIGDIYRQEYYAGEAEDMGEVLSLSDTVSVPYGSFQNCLRTKDWTPLEPGIIENKFFAPNVGEIKSVVVEGGSETIVLISISP